MKFPEAATGCVLQKKELLEISQNSWKKTCIGLFINKVRGLGPATLLRKRLWHRSFFVNFTKFLTTSFPQNTSRRLLLSFYQKILMSDKLKYKKGSFTEKKGKTWNSGERTQMPVTVTKGLAVTDKG